MRLSRILLSVTLVVSGLSSSSGAQTARRWVPPPLRVSVPLPSAWEGLEKTLEQEELPVKNADRNRGVILTDYVEFISGPLTASHIVKIGERPKLLDGDWVRVEYQYEITLTYVEEKETLVTVATNIRALKRQFLGGEEWVNIVSNGRLEENLMTRFGKLMFGETFNLNTPKRGYWERMPSFDQDSDKRPSIVGPERRP